MKIAAVVTGNNSRDDIDNDATFNEGSPLRTHEWNELLHGC